uniref:Aspartic peptidase DDI1-type domain-containing protein n=1 Tax=Physcomitrium patens TaxID=3218 RepID=A0A2K1IMV7_PHYPA|nr:hypothetical protein PHYPA_026927 [Physcomitrium patens]
MDPEKLGLDCCQGSEERGPTTRQATAKTKLNLSMVTSTAVRPFAIPVTIGCDHRKHHMVALLDSGASSCFIDQKAVKELGLPVVTKLTPANVEIADGSHISSGMVTHETHPVEVVLGDGHRSLVSFNVIKSSYTVVLGLSWLEKHNPQIDWKQRHMHWAQGHRHGGGGVHIATPRAPPPPPAARSSSKRKQRR